MTLTLQVNKAVVGYNTALAPPVTLTTQPGEVLAVLGPNGVGKTTLFKSILGLIPLLGGQVSVAGRNIHKLSPKQLARTIAYVPQAHSPPFPFSVEDVVVMGVNPHLHEWSSPKEEHRALAQAALDQVGVGELASRDYTRLSGGERQLVLIARALVQRAPILMLDEPSAHLDYGNTLRMLNVVRALADEGYTIVMITHAPEHAFWFADRVLTVLADDIQLGAPTEILTAAHISRIYSTDVAVHRIPETPTVVCYPDITASRTTPQTKETQ
ncbi:ABC transporter ATP-binding protein [Corynebacterium sp.]|uniref:ABC transporter ATP-binding protein n=1 Tax=Corynebacterium sp. TaxID=1720 RepID=UPI00373519A3